MKNEIRTERVTFRLTKYEKNKMKILAKHYAGGDVSAWIRWSIINADRMMLDKNGPERRSARSRKKET